MSEAPKRLALFLRSFAIGGTQRWTLSLAEALARRGYEVDLVVVRARGPFLRDLSPSVNLVPLHPWWRRLPGSRRRKSDGTLENAPALAGYLRRARPTALVSTSNHANRTALLASRLARVPTRLVLTVGTPLGPRKGKTPFRVPSLKLCLVRRWYPRADAIVAVSEGVADDVVRATGLPRERVTTIYNPVVTAELKEKMQIRLDHPWFKPGAPPVLLGVGRFTGQKDFATLLRAFLRVQAVRAARLLILGDGRNRAGLRALATRLGMDSEVEMPGFDMNPFHYMACASVFVLSSVREGLPAVLLQALACGCPVVSTDCPYGPGEILDGGVYGRLVPVGDDAAMAEAILATLDNPPDRSRLRRRAAEFSVDRAADRYLEVMLGSGIDGPPRDM